MFIRDKHENGRGPEIPGAIKLETKKKYIYKEKKIKYKRYPPSKKYIS